MILEVLVRIARRAVVEYKQEFIYLHSFQMTRYKQTDFADEETSSIQSGSIHLNEVRTSPNMHIRFANRVSS